MVSCQLVLVMLFVAVTAAQVDGTLPGAVTILKDVEEARLGEPLTLNCSLDQPTPGLWWRHKGRNISSAPLLQLLALSCEELGTYMCLQDGVVLLVVDVEVQDSQCTTKQDLFVPVVASLSCGVAILLCLTLCLTLWRRGRKQHPDRHRHDNDSQQNDIINELQEVEPHPQVEPLPQEEARLHVSVVGEPLPSPPSTPPTEPTPAEGAANRDSDGISLDVQGYVKLDPAKGPISGHWYWMGEDRGNTIATPPRRRGSTPWLTGEGGAISQAMSLHSHSSRSLPTTPLDLGPHPLETITEGSNEDFWVRSAEHARPMYLGGAAKPNTPPYTSLGGPMDILAHGMEQEQTSDTAAAPSHHYQNIVNWTRTGTDDEGLSSMVSHGNQDLPCGSHDDISAGQVCRDTSPPAPPCPGRQGNRQAHPLYENILLAKEDN